MQALKNILSEAVSVLIKARVDSPALSARLLAEKAFDLDSLSVILEGDRVFDCEKESFFNKLIARRAGGEPVAYILGMKEFYGIEFKVGPDVLIPRPETEEIIELVINHFDKNSKILFADLGTGSGILAVTVAKLFPESRCIAMDLSRGALHLAYENAKLHGVADRIQFIQADFTTTVLAGCMFDLILSNPPYLSLSELHEISPEVADFEPVSALVGGKDGDELIRSSALRIAAALKSAGSMYMEIGFLQGRVAKDIFESFSDFSGNVDILKDLSGHNRIVSARKK